ncbi:uncharacterized protein LOC118435710 [Folsomia candida]|uniref:uncharacterized protein LOC118435710 n=1 Tax=Folsomia candida TaxID=158441 RepID=UPI001604E6F8|nr:uncharacterized protein LOC118435710 [Folsomia candida]
MSTNQLEQVQAVLDKHCETVELIELNPVLSLRLVPMDLPRIPSLKKLAIWEYDVSEYELYSLFSQIYKMPRGVNKTWPRAMTGRERSWTFSTCSTYLETLKNLRIDSHPCTL